MICSGRSGVLLGCAFMPNGVSQIRKSVMTLALPVTVSSLLQRSEGIVAVVLFGGVGATPLAAVGLGQLLPFIATTLVSPLAVGPNLILSPLRSPPPPPSPPPT